MKVLTCSALIFHTKSVALELVKENNGKKYAGGIFNAYENTEENIENIKKR